MSSTKQAKQAAGPSLRVVGAKRVAHFLHRWWHIATKMKEEETDVNQATTLLTARTAAPERLHDNSAYLRFVSRASGAATNTFYLTIRLL